MSGIARSEIERKPNAEFTEALFRELEEAFTRADDSFAEEFYARFAEIAEDDDDAPPEPAGDESGLNGKPLNIDHEIRGPPRQRGPSFTKRSRAAIAIARSEGLPGVRVQTRPDGTIIIHYDLRAVALDPPAEVNDFDVLFAKRKREHR
jgi:hypothetical protein